MDQPSRRRPAMSLPVPIIVIGFIFMAGIGYVAGTFQGSILSAIAPIFGARISTQQIDLSSVQTTYQQLQANFDGELDTNALIDGANRGLVEAAGDEYTRFLSAAEAEAFNSGLNGSIGGGVGIELNQQNDQIVVVRVLDGTPAQKAGVKPGDVLVAVNDESAEDWLVEDAIRRIRGEIGTTVRLTILRDQATDSYSITRAEIIAPSVYGDIDNGIGILTITRFDENTGADAAAEARSFKDQNVQGVILDLRGNGGGFVSAAKDVAGIWLDTKTVVVEKSGDRVVEELVTGSNPILNGVPTIVLVDEFSASASEIVAGALHDYDAATLLGTTTFGKGSVQQLFTLPRGAQLKVTIARWFTPNGVNISETGLTPDVEVQRTTEDRENDRDPQLDEALRRLR